MNNLNPVLKEYQEEVHKTAHPYINAIDSIDNLDEAKQLLKLAYVAIGLGEAGEVQNKVKKIIRGDRSFSDIEYRQDIAVEIGDLLWYQAELATVLGAHFGKIAGYNLHKLNMRQKNGTLKGEGDDR